MSLADLWFGLFVLIIAGYLILDGFDMGVGILHVPLARTDLERRTMLNSIGPVWDGNEVWLVIGGGVLFGVFPLVYASLFSGFYLAMMLVLVTLILRAVAIEFRSKEPGARWRRGWDLAFWVASAGLALLLGVAFGNIVRGVPLDADGNITVSLIDLLSPFALLFGVDDRGDARAPRLALPADEARRRAPGASRGLGAPARDRLRGPHDGPRRPHDRGGPADHPPLRPGHLAGHLPGRGARRPDRGVADAEGRPRLRGLPGFECDDRAAPGLGSDRALPEPAHLEHRPGVQPDDPERRGRPRTRCRFASSWPSSGSPSSSSTRRASTTSSAARPRWSRRVTRPPQASPPSRAGSRRVAGGRLPRPR